MTRPVYLHPGAAISAAGVGLAAQVRACLQPDLEPTAVEFSSLGAAVRLPYFRAVQDGIEALSSVAREALAARGGGDAARLALCVGTSSGLIGEHERAYREAVARDADSFPIHAPDQGRAAATLQQALGLQGPAYTFSTACSGGANALLHAAWMVRESRVDEALVVGFEQENQLSQQGFFALMLATRGRSRPFDRRRDGIVLGACAAALVLSSTPPAQGPVWRLRGGGSFCDTTHPTNPSADRIAHTIRLALSDAGVEPASITAIKAHGTGTRANDLAEGRGLLAALGERLPPLTSVKPAFGHTLGACGVLETLAFCGALDSGWIPPTRDFEEADPEIGVAPLRAPAAWAGGIALLNYFGFGGNNCALLVERCA